MADCARASKRTSTDAREVIETLERVGISLNDVTDTLVEDGVTLFSEAFDTLLAAVDTGRRGELRSMLDRQRYTLPHDLAVKVTDVVADWQKSGKARRLWARDATLWTGGDEGHWLDWLGITDDQVAHSGPLKEVAQEVANAGVSHAVLLGMGGSSLCPEVMRKTFGTIKGFPGAARAGLDRPRTDRRDRARGGPRRTRSSSSRASPARHSNPTSCCSTS